MPVSRESCAVSAEIAEIGAETAPKSFVRSCAEKRVVSKGSEQKLPGTPARDKGVSPGIAT